MSEKTLKRFGVLAELVFGNGHEFGTHFNESLRFRRRVNGFGNGLDVDAFAGVCKK